MQASSRTRSDERWRPVALTSSVCGGNDGGSGAADEPVPAATQSLMRGIDDADDDDRDACMMTRIAMEIGIVDYDDV